MTEQEAKYTIIEYKPIIGFKRYVEALDTAIKALEEVQQYRALGLTPELIEAMQGHNIAMINDLAEYQALGTVEELRAKNEKLQGYKNQMSIYAEQHKIILASDVLDILEELE